MKKKVVKVVDGPNSSVMHYEDGTSEVLPDGVFAQFNEKKQAKEDKMLDTPDESQDLMKLYRKKTKGEM